MGIGAERRAARALRGKGRDALDRFGELLAVGNGRDAPGIAFLRLRFISGHFGTTLWMSITVTRSWPARNKATARRP